MAVNSYGQIKLEIKFDPQARVQQRLSVTIFEAQELNSLPERASKIDSKVTVSVIPDPTNATQQFTKTIKDSFNPSWREQFHFDFNPTEGIEKISKRRFLKITVSDENQETGNKLLGGMTIPLADVLADKKKRLNGWFEILAPSSTEYKFRTDIPADDENALKSDVESKMATIMRLGLKPS